MSNDQASATTASIPDAASDAALLDRFDGVYERLRTPIDGNQPLLAHYTSIRVLESILSKSEIWFANPLFMNDLQEMRYGLDGGTRFFSNLANLKIAGGTNTRAEILQKAYFHYFRHFDEHQAFDTYIFCLAEHDPQDNDGLLSMWRGYGQHGNGAAVVFDPSKVTMVPTSPLLITKVNYVSNEERLNEIDSVLGDWSTTTTGLQLSDDKLHLASYVAFSLIKGLALRTKHTGFSEEREWRVIYYPDRDTTNALKPYLHYHIGERGVEPKLKYKIGHIAGISADDLALERLLDRVILGPSLSSPLAKRSVERMLENIGRSQFKDLLRSSTIPLRPVSGNSF
ncbi:DUF2971 domain-containing protein [Bradyrhizobium sp. SSUT112]|uniref:DUF2971 domain-containing protein n=1 Tax=Bradyrhizobium sp. SSUT112 TaxID=3040604 RepID=UPI00244C5F2D|nr:DUF2971 domain-containing protein [Bradyrhizobium sp. SSUT112]MDH2357669.1 DUF2971 domain-containing protein [Bradyrhizobium sp. SSUT112]